MEEQFGKVTVTYEETEDRTQMSRPEDSIVRELVESGYDCRRSTEVSWPVLYHLSHLRANLTEWLPIGKDDTVLEFGADTGQLTGGFLKKAARVVCLEENIGRCRILAKRYETAENLTVYGGDLWRRLEALEQEYPGTAYDWIIAAGVLPQAERAFPGERPESEAIRRLLQFLKPGGHLVLAADNRFGLKYWAGAMEPHTGRYFDSLSGNGKTFSKKELERILEKSGCTDAVFYYPYPERWFPMSIYSDRWLPKAGELNTNLRNFEGERLVLFDEEKVYDQLIADGRFTEFANTFLCIAGPAMGELPVYVKYSNDRDDRFCIRTDIMDGPDGKEVRKVPVSQEAKEHVQNLKHWEQILNETCQKSGIRANRCELRNHAACFEFLEGRTYEAKFEELRKKQDYAGLAAELQNYRWLLLDTLKPELQPFVKSVAFIQMFGNPEFFKAYQGAPVNNLDWIFGNLMETKEGVQIIDYEWTFPVQVPVEYLLWRAVSLYLHGKEDIRGLGLMTQLGISPEEEKLFEEMEHHFQRWLLGGNVTIGEQYLATAGRTITLDQMIRSAKKNRIQVYVDTGNGFSDGESFWADTEPDKNGVIRLMLTLPEGTRNLRIDPAEQTCLVNIRRLAGELGGSYPLTYVHNGRELEAHGILYTTQDPQITVTNLVEGTRQIHVELMIEELLPDTAYACMNLLNRVRAAERIYGSAPFRMAKKIKQLVKNRR